MTLARVTRKTTASNTGGLVSFLTVAKASANRMLDAPLGMVSSWADGQPLYSSSFGGANWHWQADFPAATATDNETTCRPTSWIAGGLNGAAVRDLSGNPKNWKQAAWTVDSTTADNEGASTVKTDVEIQRRWGAGVLAQISTPVTITYAQSPAAATELLYEITASVPVKIVGTPTITKAGTVLTAVQLQVRTPGAEVRWAITGVGLGAADVGKIVVITASGTPANVTAYASVLRDDTGGKVVVSPFGTYSETTGAFTQITPVVGDTVEIRDMSATTLSVGTIEGHVSAFAAAAGSSTTGARTQFDSIMLLGSSTANVPFGTLLSVGGTFYYTRTVIKDINLAGFGGNQFAGHNYRGGLWTGTVNVRSSAQLAQIGALNANISPRSGALLTVLSDCYFQNTQVSGTDAMLSTGGGAFFDRTVASATLVLSGRGGLLQSGAIADWGTNNAGFGLVVRSGCTYAYATKPTINATLGAGRESSVGGVDTLYAAYPATGAVNLTNFAAVVLSA